MTPSMKHAGMALAIALSSVACSSTIDVGQAGADGGAPGSDAGASGSDTGTTALPPGTADVTGTVNGESFVVKDAAGFVYKGPVSNELWVTILDHANVCTAVEQGAESFASTKGVRLDLLSDSPTPVAIVPGTFALGDTRTAKPKLTAFFLSTDSSCTSGGGRVNATAGTLTISAITSTAIQGTFDLTFASGSLKGSFGAAVCGPSSGSIKCAQ